jgi:hypothetical protein
MKIKMLKSEMGSLDGLVVTMYEEGKEYEVNEDLFGAFTRMGACEPSEGKFSQFEEEKAVEVAPKNKMKEEKLKNK